VNLRFSGACFFAPQPFNFLAVVSLLRGLLEWLRLTI
jgi:hypothetical protein